MDIKPLFEAPGKFQGQDHEIPVSIALVLSGRFGRLISVAHHPVFILLNVAETSMKICESLLDRFNSVSKAKSFDGGRTMLKEVSSEDLARFLENSFVFHFSAVSAAEAFINMTLPDNAEVVKKSKNRDEEKIVGEKIIDKKISIREKLDAYSRCLGLDIGHQRFYNEFRSAIEDRHGMIHFKHREITNVVNVIPIYEKLTNVNYVGRFNAVIELIEYLKPGFIKNPSASS